jgi:type VI secretion system protein ImpE
MNAHELFEAGRLREAVAASLEDVRAHPTDTARRLFLAELLGFSGELERADNQLSALGQNDPQAMGMILLFRHLVRAEQARQDVWTQGRMPEFSGPPDASVRLLLEAAVRVREGSLAEAVGLLDQAEEQRPKLAVTCNGQPFSDFRDLDDLAAGILEALSMNGQYYWVPLARIEMIEFREPARPRDLLWRRTHLILRDGADVEVFCPVLYPGSAAEADDLLRLGRATDWRGGEGTPVRGVGQRTFLVGEEATPILEIQTVTFSGSTTEPQAPGGE